MSDHNDRDMVSMEEGQAGETSGTGMELSNEIVQNATGSSLMSSYAEKNLKLLDDVLPDEKAGDEEQTTKPRIPKVPDMIRNNHNLKKYFEPRLVSIGPYHHENKNLKVTQEMKVKLAAMFIKEHGINKGNIFLKIIKEIEDLKKCYEVDAIKCYRDDELAWMFLIDGCVVLHFIYCRQLGLHAGGTFEKMEIFKSNGLEIVKGMTETYKFAMDLFLLENQLPYQVLKLLINSTENSEKLKASTLEFLNAITYSGVHNQVPLPLEDPPHLLHQIQTGLIHSIEKKKSSIIERILKKSMKIIDILFYNLLGLMIMPIRILPHSSILDLDLTYMHNIGELKEAGIKLKSSGTCYLTDISFSGGTLKLPSICVNKLTAFKFLNFVAYEMSLNSPTKFEVSAYIFFLASLMARPEDVKELRVKGILTHVLSSDEDIVKLFKEISNDDMVQPFLENYSSIRREMHDHCSKRHNAWKAQLKNKYFESPWSLIALVGAIIALAITILQTVYTILAYYE